MSRARVFARAWAETLSDGRRLNQAALFARTTMEAFAAVATPGLRLSPPFAAPAGALDSTASQLARTIGRQAAGSPSIEAAHFLTGLFTAMAPSRHRSELGAFYTPPALSVRLLDLAENQGVDWREARVLDPACGGGAFLLQAARRIRLALSGSEPAFILSHLGIHRRPGSRTQQRHRRPSISLYQRQRRGVGVRAQGDSPARARGHASDRYAGAIEGRDVWLRPDQVTRMTDAQAARTDEVSRGAWSLASMRPSKGEMAGRWYAVNTRESIRDDTLRCSLIQNGAVIERTGLATTSPAGRYAVRAAFAALLDPVLDETTFLAKSALITKAVIEDFAARFFEDPGVIFLSESANKVIARDDELSRAIGLNIASDKNLPDIVLVDLGPKHPLLVFVEVVATDGPVNEMRKTALLRLAADADLPPEHVTFVTAFLDRSAASFRKTVSSLAWGSYAWFASEPQCLIVSSNKPAGLRGG